MISHFAPLCPTDRLSIHHLSLKSLLKSPQAHEILRFWLEKVERLVCWGLETKETRFLWSRRNLVSQCDAPKRSISRILFPEGFRSLAQRFGSLNQAAIISLGRSLPTGSCGLPASLAASHRCAALSGESGRSHAWPCSCWGLPGRSRYRAAGELLPHLFTVARTQRVFETP